MLDCGTVNVKHCEIYYEHLNDDIFKECLSVQISLVVNFISAKQRCLVKSSFQFFWGEVKTGSLNSIYKTDRENKDHKMSIIGVSFLCRT